MTHDRSAHDHGAYDQSHLGLSDTGHTMAGHSTAVLGVRCLHWASRQNVASPALSRLPRVVEATVNPVAQSATVVLDSARDLARGTARMA